jgi:2-polyprenyl-3-methyl-5-hydroxy-6-metoxy-1,4-benzoquinol methylase
MEESFLFSVLIDPVSGEDLKPDTSFTSLSSGTGKPVYQIRETIPVILTGDNSSIRKSDLHIKNASDFRYQSHYQVDAELFDYSEKNEPAVTRHEIRRLHESIIRETGRGNSLILDVGCGNGWAAEALIPKGHRVISMDISTKNPHAAIEKTSHPFHAGLVADVFNLPFRKNTFDYIIASEILEHVPDPGAFITNLISILKENGRVIITTPYNEKIEYSLCVHCNRVTPRHAHLHSINEKNIIRFLPEDGISHTITVFSSRYLALLRSHIILKYFPWSIWRMADSILCFLLRNEMRLKIIIDKRVKGS